MAPDRSVATSTDTDPRLAHVGAGALRFVLQLLLAGATAHRHLAADLGLAPADLLIVGREPRLGDLRIDCLQRVLDPGLFLGAEFGQRLRALDVVAKLRLS